MMAFRLRLKRMKNQGYVRRERETDRQADRQTDRQTETKRDRERDYTNSQSTYADLG